ncbi:MAG: M48 family metalloprotease [Fimbriimonadaceae bacterium]|nr:M48 family metalloprotease [Fimbriimonadaceae bacterium]QYK59223.1 MAG: M48 family metalloprotease [Fimbriimonadaceae bacterium]
MRTALVFLITLLVGGQALADPFRPSVKDQISLGKRAAADVRKKEKVLPETDPRVQELRRIGNKLVTQIPEVERKRRPFEYTFDVIDSKDVNAFALPGGPIFFYTGLLDHLPNEDAVAGILGHEIVHIRNQHWASAYADNTKRRLGLAVVLTLLRAGDTVFDIASVSDSLLFSLPYSRRHESEADRVGYDMMSALGYNPQGMVDSFTTLKQLSGGGSRVEILSTHPDTDKRIQALSKRVSEEKRSFEPVQPRAEGLYKPIPEKTNSSHSKTSRLLVRACCQDGH